MTKNVRLNVELRRTFLVQRKIGTLSISAIIGMRNRASKSRSVIRLLTKATSVALGRPFSVKIVSTRNARVSAPGGKVRSNVSNLPCVGPKERMSAVMRS